MSSSSKRQTTMAKLMRERAVKDKRALKQEKKDERKAAAASAKADGDTAPVPDATDEPDAD